MKREAAENQKSCPREEIAAYVDGEISQREELELEMHFAVCPACREELNAQKKLLCALDFALLSETEIEVPENFTKIVVAKAESNVSGLRRPQERRNALLISTSLFLLCLFGLGAAEAGKFLSAFGKFGEQFLAVGGFVAHLFYDIAVGIAVIVRSLSNQFVFSSAFSVTFTAILFLFSLLAASRLIARFNRA